MKDGTGTEGKKPFVPVFFMHTDVHRKIVSRADGHPARE